MAATPSVALSISSLEDRATILRAGFKQNTGMGATVV
jgi:hypothetical protein